jgi:DNA polymerase III alpha subunit
MEKLLSKFKITPIQNEIYQSRLQQEINFFQKNNFINFLLRMVEIYESHINKYPNMLRGSAGSSLLLYYLGINKFDPLKYSISLERFINPSRKTYPDIDFDLPVSIRNQLFDVILLKNSDTIRMTSDYKHENNIYFESLIKEDPSLNIPHNSALIIYSHDQKDLIQNNKILPNQIKFTKNNIGEYNLKKIDLLSNTALEQLYNISNKRIEEYDFDDKDVFEFICMDDGIGITFAETHQIQYVIKILKPKSIEELSMCLAIVRPFASSNITNSMNFEYLKKQVIYDDDFILYLSNLLGIDFERADEIRRLFKSNQDKEKMFQFISSIELSNEIDQEEKFKLKKLLFNISKYSFCKAHSINYARMIYCLYWNKFYLSKKFWKSTIKCVKGQYRDWVYIRKGLENGLKFKGIENCSPFYHLIYTGYWLKKDFVSRCYLRKISNQNNSNNSNNSNNIIELDDSDNQEKLFEDETINLEESKDINNLEEAKDIYNIEDLEDLEDISEKQEEHNQQENLQQIENLEQIENNKNHEKYDFNNVCEFRGIIAGVGKIYTRYKKFQMVITIGYDNNKFVNLHLNKQRDLTKFKQVIGKGFWIDAPKPYIVVTKMNLL